LHRLGRLSAEDAVLLEQDLERRVRGSWERLRERDPKCSIAYIGLALSAYREKKSDAAVQVLEQGLAACGDRPEFYQVLGRLLRPRDPRQALAWLERARERRPDDLDLLRLYAETAAAAVRPDLMLLACRDAHQRRPDLPWACRLEALALLATDRPTAAVEALAPIRASLPGDAAGAELYVRALCLVGAEHLAEAFLESLPADGLTVGGLGGARGYLAANRPDAAAHWATKILERNPEHVPARRVHAEALRQLAEDGDAPAWNAQRVWAALKAYDWLLRRDPADLQLTQRIAWLQLKGLKAPELAVHTAEPLRAADPAALSPAARQTLAAVLIAANQPRDALRVLDGLAPSAGAHILRAQANAGLKDWSAVRRELTAAAELPRSPRESAELLAVSDLLRGSL
jgi:tetratricopeptide (TPR) repeat protein